MNESDKDTLFWFFFVLLLSNTISSIIGQLIYHHFW
jgi:hypothetical protein